MAGSYLRGTGRDTEADLDPTGLEEAVGADEEALFALLYKAHSLRLTGLVRRFVFDDHLVDDIVQETFVRAYGARLHLEYLDATEDRAPWPWLAAVARNLALDTLRKQSAVARDEIDEIVLDAAPSLDDPEVRYLSGRRREGIAEALEAVCPRQRRILLLREVHGWSAERIAASEGASVHSVKSALARARRAFRASYAMVAERSGLSVLTGGLVTRAQSRVRSIRDRLARMPDAVAHGMATAPAATNTFMTLAVVGAAGAVGLLAGPHEPPPAPDLVASSRPVEVPMAAPASMPEIAGDPLAAAAADAEVRAEPTPSAEASVTAQAPAPAASTPTPSGTSASTDLDSGAIVPVEDPPAGANVSGKVSQNEESTKVFSGVEFDPDGDGDGSGFYVPAQVDCPPPEHRKALGQAMCTANESLAHKPNPTSTL